MTSFLKNPHAMRFESGGDSFVIKIVLLVELMQQILRAFDGAGDQLREKHHVGGVSDEMVFRLLPSAINLDHVAEALKGVKRETDRQDDIHDWFWQLPANQMRQPDEIAGEEIEILEDKQNSAR